MHPQRETQHPTERVRSTRDRPQPDAGYGAERAPRRQYGGRDGPYGDRSEERFTAWTAAVTIAFAVVVLATELWAGIKRLTGGVLP